MFKMQTLNCLSLKISTYNIHAYISSQKRDVTLQNFIESTDGILAHMKN